MKTKRFIRLLFNANKTYDRQVIAGVGRYLNTAQCNWEIFLEDDFRTQQTSLKQWQGDGLIADLDDPYIEHHIARLNVPVVGIGGSYACAEHYPNVPYVATDNRQVIMLAFEHLKSRGLEHFAFYGIPRDPHYRWANEREKAFATVTQQEGFASHIFHGHIIDSQNWPIAQQQLCRWLEELPKPIGIIAVTDSRARHLLQACDELSLMVPERIAIVGIDDEEVARYLTRTSLSSVQQGCQEMGYRAAELLDKLLASKSLTASPSRILIPPLTIHARQSSDFQALNDPYVIQAMHYIRQHACHGIKTEQVLDYIGLSRSNLEARFKLEQGQSIHQTIHHFKLQQACQLLRTTDISIAQIAYYCGYPSIQYMYAVFKKNFNLTPKKYRNRESILTSSDVL
ncbi:XylR family transcriptional regulator [Celerinatantimonas yamalensis]|uniref:DNA-binding transcriptional regulator n=1 Tax=Celerinatantimonas yamalensis TaxID=559956 RepID=A0ABW9G5F7_9GAMM